MRLGWKRESYTLRCFLLLLNHDFSWKVEDRAHSCQNLPLLVWLWSCRECLYGSGVPGVNGSVCHSRNYIGVNKAARRWSRAACLVIASATRIARRVERLESSWNERVVVKEVVGGCQLCSFPGLMDQLYGAGCCPSSCPVSTCQLGGCSGSLALAADLRGLPDGTGFLSMLSSACVPSLGEGPVFWIQQLSLLQQISSVYSPH